MLHPSELFEHYLVDIGGQIVEVQVNDLNSSGSVLVLSVLFGRIAVELRRAQSFLLGSVRDILRCLIWWHEAADTFICFIISWSSFIERSFVHSFGFYGFVTVSIEGGFEKVLSLFLLFVICVILSHLILNIVI
jgi:hypothetical protein